MCIRDRYQRRVRDTSESMGQCAPCRSPKTAPTTYHTANASDTTTVEGFGVDQVQTTTAKQQVEVEEARQRLVTEGFGFELQRMLSSSAWDDRTQAIAGIRAKCTEQRVPPGMALARFVEACCEVVLVCLQDKVMPVYLDGLGLTKFLFGEYLGGLGSQEAFTASLERVLAAVVAKSGDRNARSAEGTRSVLAFLASSASVECSRVMAHILQPLLDHKEVSAIRGRLGLIDHMISEFGFSKSNGITLELVMGFVRPHLDAADQRIRRTAVEVTVSCYKHQGDWTRKFITNVKPALIKLLEARFAELNQPSRGPRKATSTVLPTNRDGRPKIRRNKARPPTPIVTAVNPGGGPGIPGSCGRPHAVITNTKEVDQFLSDCPQLFSISMGEPPILSDLSMKPRSLEGGPSSPREQRAAPGSLSTGELGSMGSCSRLDDLMRELESSVIYGLD
eukprot:TRINITY_DN116_c0_g1_i1.p1 TRINITY_DN116_c0_g1~~TRINITY_DN116_c0_g1_i1.p1  ORF type:complete len:449 (-),score=100.53 TRINITY_DN116_c0_g1_i1:347-1693(-)